MAIFHFSLQNISASKGKCSVAAAAYRSGQELYCERQGISYSYEKNADAISFILKPEHAPEWCLDREKLWNEVEKKESSKNSRYAKEINIALPIELSDEEQEELIREYCQSAFVDAGMVADIAIHRIEKGNPHAHVMLTNRPFNSDGTWGQKAKTEYIRNEKGELTYTKNGNIRQRKIPLIDWDEEQTLIRWRREWAKQVNSSLERNGFSERISAESFETDGIKATPTIHEGRGHDRKENRAYNEEVRQQAKTKDSCNDTKERIYTYERFDLLTKNLTENQRKLVTQLSGTLKIFINFENVEDKKRMLNNWSTSTYTKMRFGVDVAKNLQTMEQQGIAVQEADKILFDMSKRLCETEYKFLDTDRLTEYEIKWIADKTIRFGLLTEDEIKRELTELRPYLLEKQVLLITKQPFISRLNLDETDKDNKNKRARILERHGRSILNYNQTNGQTMEEFYGQDYKKLKYLFTDIERAQAIREVIDTHYNEVLAKAFPAADLKQVTTLKKEHIYNLVMYYNPENREMTLDDLFSLPEKGKFTTQERTAGLKYICSGEAGAIQENAELKRVLGNPALRNLFIAECGEDGAIDPKLLDAAIISAKESEMAKGTALKKEDASMRYAIDNAVSIAVYLDKVLTVATMLFPGTSEQEIAKRRAKNKKLAELERSMGRKKGIQPHI